MLVRVKESLPDTFHAFYGGELLSPGDEFELIDLVEVGKDGEPIVEDGEPVVVRAAEKGFSKSWMEKVEEPEEAEKPAKTSKKDSK